MRAGLAIIKGCSIASTSMKHLDISFNMISAEETKDIASYLETNNQTLIGIHYEGNLGLGVFDSRGFLRLPKSATAQINDDETSIKSAQHLNLAVKPRINGFKCLGQNKMQTFDCLSVDNCWICDGWQEITFEITTGCSNSFQGGPVFLHLDFENYRPHYMNQDENNADKYILHRMCPPKREIHFFFSDPTQPVLFFSQNYPSTPFLVNGPVDIQFYSEEEKAEKAAAKKSKSTASNSNVQQVSSSSDHGDGQNLKRQGTRRMVKRYFELQYLDSTIIEYVKPKIVNCISIGMDKKVLTRGEYDPLIFSKPREPETYYMITKTDQWTFEISLFSTYVRDSQELVDRCFEVDWAQCRLEKPIASCGDVELTKAVMKKFYPVYKNMYKYLSSIGMVGDIPCITSNQYNNLLVRTEIIDGKKLKNSDGDISFVACNAGTINKEKNYRNPDKALVRYEFLEALGRLSIEKYARKDKGITAQDAFEILMSEKLINGKLAETESQQDWRDFRYWNEECDLIFKKHLGMVKQLWETWADSRRTEKRYFMTYKTMSIIEFVDIIKFYELLDERLTERDIYLSFNLAMMTQEDETTNDRFIQMIFVEFLEALARIAEKKSMVPVGEKPEDYTEEERKELHLSFKIESLLEEILSKQEMMKQDKKGGVISGGSMGISQKLSSPSTDDRRRSSKLPPISSAAATAQSRKSSPRMSVAAIQNADGYASPAASNRKMSSSLFSKQKNEQQQQQPSSFNQASVEKDQKRKSNSTEEGNAPGQNVDISSIMRAGHSDNSDDSDDDRSQI